MNTRLLAGLIAAAILSLAIPFVLIPSPDEPRPGIRTADELDRMLDRLDPDALPREAEAFLATDRPWRAARVMRRYLARIGDPPTEQRVRAARAEARWGAWPAVHELLEGARGLDAHDNGIGLFLLARARDEGGDDDGAIDAYRAFLAHAPPAGALERERDVARLRLGLALARAGRHEEARRELDRSAIAAGEAAGWLPLLEAGARASAGDTAGVRRLVAGYDTGFQGLVARRARVQSALRAGDLGAARSLANQARDWARTDATRSEFLVAAGRIAVEMGDTAAGRAAFRATIERSAMGGHAREAAALLRNGGMSPDDHLAVARVLRAQGLHEQAIPGFRRWLASQRGTAVERAAVHMEHAEALFYAERYDEVASALSPIAGQRSARLLRARAANRLGNVDEAVRLYLDVAAQYAGTGNGAHALYLAASVRHDAGDHEAAATLYRRVVTRYRGTEVMGLSVMRMAGLALAEGNAVEAARLWDSYRRAYPRGALALQSLYWSGRAREAAGDTAAARSLYREVLERERDSYYALLASDRLGESFWPLPLSPTPADSPEAARRVATWMRGVDLLRAAGFPDEASAEVDRVLAGAGSDRTTLYALAEALAERGYSQRAIRIGIRLQRSGPPDLRLLRILYPFPYRTLITEEARDRGLDPFIAAALIRQESLFEERITSHAGARGLMQIMPATGARLAADLGIEPWDPEVLYHPEINVHIGTHYLAQHMRNYDGSLPAVFSAYNAGAHRVEWWSEFVEWGDDELFTERIPYRETRDYVKILTRNHALYGGLYGD